MGVVKDSKEFFPPKQKILDETLQGGYNMHRQLLPGPLMYMIGKVQLKDRGKPSPYYQQNRASRALSDAKEGVNSAAKKARKDCGPRFIDE